jgi:hypothetical protein
MSGMADLLGLLSGCMGLLSGCMGLLGGCMGLLDGCMGLLSGCMCLLGGMYGQAGCWEHKGQFSAPATPEVIDSGRCQATAAARPVRAIPAGLCP